VLFTIVHIAQGDMVDPKLIFNGVQALMHLIGLFCLQGLLQ